MTVRRAFLCMAACYPITPVGFVAGIAAGDHNPMAILGLLLFYAALLYSLKACFAVSGRARGWFLLALVMAGLHALLAFVFVVSPLSTRERLIAPLLLVGVLPVVVVVGLGGCHLAATQRRPLLATLLGATALGCAPLGATFGGVAFGVCFAAQAVMMALLGALGPSSLLLEPAGTGFIPVSEGLT